MRTRVVAAVALFTCLVVVNAVAVPLVFGRGLAFLASPLGLLAQLPLTAVLAVATWVVLVRVRRLDGPSLGLVPGPHRRDLVAGFVLGLFVTTGAALVVVVAGGATLAPTFALGPVALAVAALSTVVNAAFQQLSLVGIARAASSSSPLSIGAVVVSSIPFVLAHAHPAATPVYLANVLFFGVQCLLLFDVRGRPSWTLPIAFHGGTNVATLFVVGSPAVDGFPSLLGFASVDVVLSGGAGALESGAVLLVVNTLLVSVLVFFRTRRPRVRSSSE